MSTILGTALSGLLAQSKRLEVSASNVANLRSSAPRPGAAPAAGEFVAHRVALSTRADGGVEARVFEVSPGSFLTAEPGAPDAGADGLVARPNVSLERELVNQIEALRSFQANLKVIEIENRKLGDLLDLVS